MPNLPQQKRILILRAFPNRSTFPTLPALKNRGATILFASWNDKLQRPVQELEIPYINIKRFYRRKYTQAFAAHTKAITEMLEHVDPALPSQLLGESSHYRLLWNAFQLFKESFTQTRVFIDLYLDLLDQYKPESIVLFNEISPPGRTMAKVAKIRKIPSIAIQHGLFIGHVYRALTTDKIIVWGELPRKFWLERGCEPEQVVSVGAIAHNHWPERPAYSPSGPKRKAPQRVLLIGQNPAAFISMSLHRTTIDTIMQSIGQMPGVKFTIKPHPGEDPTPYKTEIKKYRLNNVELVTHGGIEQFLLDADLVITLFSTVGAEAMFMGIPVIVVNLSDQPPIAPYASMCPIATDVHSLSNYIKKILSDPIYRERLVENGEKFAHDYFGSTDSQAAGRAADLIMKSLSSINRK